MGHRFVGVSSKAMEVQVATIDPARTSPRSMDIICEVSGKMSSLVQALVKGLGVVHLVCRRRRRNETPSWSSDSGPPLNP